MADPSVPGPIDSQLGSYYTRLSIGKYKRPAPFESSVFDITSVINFPLPNELSDNTSVGYNTINLESVGDVINGSFSAEATGLRNSTALIDFSKNLVSNVLGAAAGKIGGDILEKITKSGVSAASGAFPSDQISSAIQQRLGYAPNPNPSVAFQGPELRSFSYTWVLYPKNDVESANVEKIVKMLKQNALPSNYFSGSAAILNYPSMCQLNFFPWDEGGLGHWNWTDNSIIKYKKCVMSAVNVRYNQFGPPAFFEGTQAPVTVSITIAFKELEYMLAEDWGATRGVVQQPTITPTPTQTEPTVTGTTVGGGFGGMIDLGLQVAKGFLNK